MQKKVGTILDENVLKKAKENARAQHIKLNRLFEEALSEYLARQPVLEQKISTVETSFGVIPISIDIVQKIIQEEIYDTE